MRLKTLFARFLCSLPTASHNIHRALVLHSSIFTNGLAHPRAQAPSATAKHPAQLCARYLLLPFKHLSPNVLYIYICL